MDDPNPTDVLTFDLRDDDSDAIEGEIVVSVDTARYQADHRGLDLRDELLRYVIHGVLHLNGLDDHTTAGRRQMRKAENDVLRTLAGTDARAGSVTNKHQGRAGRTRRNLSRKTR